MMDWLKNKAFRKELSFFLLVLVSGLLSGMEGDTALKMAGNGFSENNTEWKQISNYIESDNKQHRFILFGDDEELALKTAKSAALQYQKNEQTVVDARNIILEKKLKGNTKYILNELKNTKNRKKQAFIITALSTYFKDKSDPYKPKEYDFWNDIGLLEKKSDHQITVIGLAKNIEDLPDSLVRKFQHCFPVPPRLEIKGQMLEEKKKSESKQEVIISEKNDDSQETTIDKQCNVAESKQKGLSNQKNGDSQTILKPDRKLAAVVGSVALAGLVYWYSKGGSGNEGAIGPIVGDKVGEEIIVNDKVVEEIADNALTGQIMEKLQEAGHLASDVIVVIWALRNIRKFKFPRWSRK